MLAHVTGWKHTLKYLKRAHADKIPFDEAEAAKNPALRKTIKEVAAEVEKAEGRGQLKVILKEPRDVPAFKDLRSAIPKALPPGPLMGPKMPLFGPRFPDPVFPGEHFPHGEPYSDHSMGAFEDSDFKGYSDRRDFNEPDFNRRPFQDHYRSEGGDGFGIGHLNERPGRLFPEEGLDNQMGRFLMDRPLGKPMERQGLLGHGPDRNSLPNTLLTYLDTFQIENESDAQIVLKVTQKLTDALMEYRLRSSSSGSGMNSLPMRPSGFPSRMSGGLSGPARHIEVPPRRPPDLYN
ncbi:uncharacterized protein si:ch211-197h24.6 isoform X2 [Thalassophryne amazonica]|nr:uncharacterized protein si:ch211-197h24.6 isoform X2 [Thalassophryne amazonica]